MKKYLKFLSLICALVLSFSSLAVIVAAGGTGTKADPYIITTAQELQNINNNVTAHYILGNDIDLAEMDFTPIGNADSGAFSGSFDGNGYKISGLNVFSGKYAGLFGSNEGVIKNVILDNIYVYGTRYVGGVVGQNTDCGTVENCTVLSGLVESDGGINHIQIGGVCGRNNGSFNGSFSNGADIDAETDNVRIYAGGLVGYTSVSTDISNSYNTGKLNSYVISADYSFLGGLVGYASELLIINNSINAGVISFLGIRYTMRPYGGGLVGWADSSNISNSFNTSNVSVIKENTNNTFADSNPGDSYAGGIIGRVETTSSIVNCYNTGDMHSGYSGGLVAHSYGDISLTSCYNTGKITTIKKTYSSAGGLLGGGYGKTLINCCYNTGNVSARSDSGGLVGEANSTVTISSSYNTGNVTSSDDSSGGLVGGANSTVTISNSYNTGNLYGNFTSGGLIGYTETSVNCANSYSVIGSVVNGRMTKINGEKHLSWNDMKTMSSYIGWDFEEIWSIGGNCNHSFPVLKETSSTLTIDIPNKIMASGETLQLATYKNGVKTNDVKWSVTNGTAIVTSNGLVTAGSGLATITATDSDGNKANLNIYGYTPAVSMTATDRTITMTTSSYSNKSYFTINGSNTDYIIDYKSNDTSVVKLTSSGFLKPVSAGTTTVTATTMGGATATQTVTVTAKAESLSLPSTLTVARGSTKNITATTTPDPTSSVITWESSDSSVATVDSNGNVTGLKCGTTIITATTDNGYSDTCTVTVNAPITEIAFETPSLTLYVGQEYKLKLNITPTDTTDTITYSTSSSTYASVTSAGTVTAKKAGAVTITATSTSGKKAYCVVTVKAWPSVLTVVDSATTITNDVITTDTTGIRNLAKLVTVKDGYNIDVTYSHQINGLNYCGTGTTIDVYDDYGNFVITYTLVVNGDVNGDSIVDVLDATNTERMATDALTFDEAQAYAANGTAIETVDATSYQYVLNKALAE